MLDIVLLTFASLNYFLKTSETKELQNCKTFKKECVNCIILTGNHLSKWDNTFGSHNCYVRLYHGNLV